MATISVSNLWDFIQSMSLSANNEQWLAEKLYESAIAKKKATKNQDTETLDRLFGVWDNADGERMAKAIFEGRKADYARETVSFDD